jgi:hypothetical protein
MRSAERRTQALQVIVARSAATLTTAATTATAATTTTVVTTATAATTAMAATTTTAATAPVVIQLAAEDVEQEPPQLDQIDAFNDDVLDGTDNGAMAWLQEFRNIALNNDSSSDSDSEHE